jgi:hypothetical protein
MNCFEEKNAQTAESSYSPRIPLDLKIYKVLKGTIDIHVHAHPDCAARLLDDIEVVAQARAVKMRAVVLKCHVSAT